MQYNSKIRKILNCNFTTLKSIENDDEHYSLLLSIRHLKMVVKCKELEKLVNIKELIEIKKKLCFATNQNFKYLIKRNMST